VPKTAVSTDSTVTVPASWSRPSPTARSRPISRVRSMTDRASVFTMPSTAITTESPSSAYRITSTWLTWSAMLDTNSSWVSTETIT
jgi:hypothetical protein